MMKILPGYIRQITPDFSSLVRDEQRQDKNLSFPQIFEEMISNTNDLQNKAAVIAEKFVVGEITDIHEVMIAAEEAGVALDLVMEIRNKMIEAYQELIRMQV